VVKGKRGEFCRDARARPFFTEQARGAELEGGVVRGKAARLPRRRNGGKRRHGGGAARGSVGNLGSGSRGAAKHPQVR
jgi:hypothetical protein